MPKYAEALQLGSDALAGRLDAAHRTMRRMKDFLRTIIEEHRAEFDSGSLTDFIDAYIEKVDESNGDGSSFDNGLAQLEQVLVELFFAGSETTSSTLTWAILFLVLHPDIQNRVRQETLDIVGRSEVPRLCHKKDMPFTEATIMEIQVRPDQGSGGVRLSRRRVEYGIQKSY